MIGSHPLAPRLSFQEGHRRKFLVVIDDTPECERALVYAAKRAERTAGAVVLLHVIVPEDAPQWLGVGDVMRAEALAEAETMLGRAVDRIRAIARVEPETVIREGNRAEVILRVIADDADIAILVLAAGIDKDGPGPLVTAIGRASGTFPIPVTIVPGQLSDAEIAALA